MQGHKFEDNVNKQLEELALRPTEGVWNRVEVTLRKDRKRRRLFFVLPLFLAIVLGSYWWIQKPGKPVVAVTGKNTINENRSWPKNSNESGGEPVMAKQDEKKEEITKKLDKTQRIVISPENRVEASPEYDATGSEIDDHETGIKRNRKSKAVKPLSFDVSPGSISKKIKKADQSIQLVNPPGNNSTVDSGEGDPGFKEIVVVPDKQKPNRTEELKEPGVVSIVADKKDSVVAVMKPPGTDSMNTIEKANTIKINSSGKLKWQWGISANAGIARVVQGGLINAFEKSLVMDAAAYNGSVQTPGSPGNNNPAFINAGLNWGAGFFVQKIFRESRFFFKER